MDVDGRANELRVGAGQAERNLLTAREIPVEGGLVDVAAVEAQRDVRLERCSDVRRDSLPESIVMCPKSAFGEPVRGPLDAVAERSAQRRLEEPLH